MPTFRKYTIVLLASPSTIVPNHIWNGGRIAQLSGSLSDLDLSSSLVCGCRGIGHRRRMLRSPPAGGEPR
jgi:hypothetical protein